MTTRKISIRRISRLVPALMLVLVIINISSISLIGLNYRVVNTDDRQSGDYFRLFNEYVLTVRGSGAAAGSSVVDEYRRLSEVFSGLSRRMTRGTALPYPDYGSIAQGQMYSENLRAHAGIVRRNLSEVLETSYRHITIMLIVSAAASIVMLVLILVSRFAAASLQHEISYGLNYIEKILTFEALPDYRKKHSRVAEVEELSDAIHRLSGDISYNRGLIDTAFHGNLDLLMDRIYKSIRKRMPCDRIALAFIDSDDNVIAETAVTSYDHYELRPGFMEPLSNTSLAVLQQSGEGRIINDLEAYSKNRKVSESTALLLLEGIKASITVPMMFDGKCLGFFFVSSTQLNAFTTKSLYYVSRVLNLMKQKFYIEYLLQEVIAGTSNAFVGLMEEKDNETSNHILRMSYYSYIIARTYHKTIKPLHPRFMREILWYSPLHDIGKVGIPDRILLKEGPLTKEEKTLMQGHVNSGVRVIEKMNEDLQKLVSAPLMQTAVDIIGGHHEKFKGGGYPGGVAGEDIPLAGRIAAVADVFDALTSKRPYKEAFSIEEAVDIMKDGMSGSFDPDVLNAFEAGLPEIRKIYDEYKEV